MAQYSEHVPAPTSPSRLFIVSQLMLGVVVGASAALRLADPTSTPTQVTDWVLVVVALVFVVVGVVMLIWRRTGPQSPGSRSEETDRATDQRTRPLRSLA
ncbi:hypothetical protein GCM10009616_14940 [Microlunatus lacustris]